MKILLLLLILTGCAAFEPPEFKPTEFNDYLIIHIVIDNDLSWLGLDTEHTKVRGAAKCKKGICTLYLPDDDNAVNDCVWLHEFKDHAVYGVKHSEDYIAC